MPRASSAKRYLKFGLVGAFVFGIALLFAWQASWNGADGACVGPCIIGVKVAQGLESSRDWPANEDELRALRTWDQISDGYGTTGAIAFDIDRDALAAFIGEPANRDLETHEIWSRWSAAGNGPLVEYRVIRQWWAWRVHLDYTLGISNGLVLKELMRIEDESY